MRLLYDPSSPAVRYPVTRLMVEAFSVQTLVSSEIDGPVIEDDSVFQIHFPAVIDHEHQLAISSPEPYTIMSNTPGVLAVDGLNIKRVSDGSGTITIRSGRDARRLKLAVSRQSGTTHKEWLAWADGSLAKHASDAIDTRIAGKDLTALPIFSTQNHSGQVYVRNPLCWCYDLREQMTCISPWNSSGGVTQAGTLITPRHIIFSEHYRIGVGATVRFIDANGNVVNRTMVRRADVGPANSVDNYATDLTVGLLDSDVPASIIPCDVAPPALSSHLPNVSKGIPALCLDQEEKALVSDLYLIRDGWVWFKLPANAQRQLFYEHKVGGDSGNPAFLIINGKLVLLTTWTSGGAGSGPSIKRNIDGINTAIAACDAAHGISTGYTVTPADLSGFPTY